MTQKEQLLRLRAEVKDLNAKVERLEAEKSFEAKLKNQAWFFINRMHISKEFDLYKVKHPVHRPALVNY